eukprot:4810755-Amphidinium_carterae.1
MKRHDMMLDSWGSKLNHIGNGKLHEMLDGSMHRFVTYATCLAASSSTTQSLQRGIALTHVHGVVFWLSLPLKHVRAT